MTNMTNPEAGETSSARLPHADRATVADSKIHQYLFARLPRDDKSRFLTGWGFAAGRPDEIRAALVKAAAAGEVSGRRKTVEGYSYEVVGPIETPTGTKPSVLTVWLVRTGFQEPTFVTIHPEKPKRNR